MLLNDEQIRFQIFGSEDKWENVGMLVFNKSLSELLSESEDCGLYGPSDQYEGILLKLNGLFLDINICFLTLQKKNHLRIKQKEVNGQIEVKIYLKNKIFLTKTYTKLNQIRMYFDLIPHYILPSDVKLKEYKKNIN